MNENEAIRHIKQLGSPKKAIAAQRFFKTGKGQYAEGDKFVGVTVPEVRKLARECGELTLEQLEVLLDSPLHEARLLALCVLTDRFPKTEASTQKVIFEFYLKKRNQINNWDLVDASAAPIVGGYLHTRGRSRLHQLSRSASLWDRRIAIVATHYFIRRQDFADTLTIAERYLHETEDLMHKASGWMLREVGKQNEKALTDFLLRHAQSMPRTMLRYAIERLSPVQKKQFMIRDGIAVSPATKGSRSYPGRKNR